MDISKKLKPESVIKKTGKSIEYWYTVINKFGADKGHTNIAMHLKEKHKLSSWWAQSLTTRFEFDHDLRKLYERTGKNGLTITAQKTIAASVEEVFAALTESKHLKKWFSPYLKLIVKPGAVFNYDEVVSGKFLNVDKNKKVSLVLYSLENKETSNVVIDFITKDSQKTTIKVTQNDLSTEISVDAQKDFWKNCFESAKNYLEA